MSSRVTSIVACFLEASRSWRVQSAPSASSWVSRVRVLVSAPRAWARLATTVPPPHFHTVRYAGVLAAASKWRARVVPPPKPPTASDDTEHDCSTCTAKDRPPTHRSGYRPWRELLMRSFKIDVERCQSCGRRMKLRALVMTSAGIERYLRWLGEPVDPPALAPARDPPYFKSRVIRRRLGQPAQAELFD